MSYKAFQRKLINPLFLVPIRAKHILYSKRSLSMFVELEKSACVHIMNLFNEHFSEESSHISINYLYYVYTIYNIYKNICCFTTPTRMRSSIHFVFSAHKLLLWPKGASENNICCLHRLKDLVWKKMLSWHFCAIWKTRENVGNDRWPRPGNYDYKMSNYKTAVMNWMKYCFV